MLSIIHSPIEAEGDGEDEDGLWAPSVLSTIHHTDGNEYREFRRDGPGGVEEVYWIRVVRRR